MLFVYVGQSEVDEMRFFTYEEEEEFVTDTAERVETPPKSPSPPPPPPPPPQEKVKYTLKSFISGHRTLPQDAAHRTPPTGRCPQDSAHRIPPTGRRPQDAAHRTLPTGRCPQDAAHRTLAHWMLPHRTLPTGFRPQDTAHRTLSQDAATGCRPQDAAHRTLPTGLCPQDSAHRIPPTGCRPQDAAHRMPPTGRRPQDAVHRTLAHWMLPHRTLPTGLCPQDAVPGRCPQDAAHRTLPTGRCPRTLPTGHCPQDVAPQDSVNCIVLCIPESLSPAEFCGQLLDFLKCCSEDHKLGVLKAIITLHRENQLSTELITHGLLTSLRACLHLHMSGEEQRFVEEVLNFLVCVNPHSVELAAELLSLLADQQLGLQGRAACMLQVLGVDDAQQWLPPKLKLLDSEARKQPNPQDALREVTGQWLHTWTDQYRVHKRLELPQSSGSKSVLSPVEVLRYFCWLQREEQKQPRKAPPEGRRDTVLLDTQAYRWKAVQRLGETYSMSRIREPRETQMFRTVVVMGTRGLHVYDPHIVTLYTPSKPPGNLDVSSCGTV
ncbi:hypothetical protein NFI96_019587 [Prochilodus magdalenae]|nr:hypothetical protein NFI96_019587 [Prochilodus magdalenae]